MPVIPLRVLTTYHDLTANLLETCTGSGLLKGTLLASPDIDDAWMRLAPAFYGDAVRNFNAYPE